MKKFLTISVLVTTCAYAAQAPVLTVQMHKASSMSDSAEYTQYTYERTQQ